MGGGGISFNPLALHKIAFDEIAAVTGTKHLVPPGEDGVKKAQFLYKPTNETTHKTLSLTTEQGRLSYFDLMRNPSALQWIRYDVVDRQFGLLYTFGIDAKNQTLNTGTLRLGVPRVKEWTDDMIYWSVINHKENPLISNPGVAPSLTAKINQLRKDTPSFQ